MSGFKVTAQFLVKLKAFHVLAPRKEPAAQGAVAQDLEGLTAGAGPIDTLTAGFIGSHVALRLLPQGDRVIGLDNLSDNHDVNLIRRA